MRTIAARVTRMRTVSRARVLADRLGHAGTLQRTRRLCDAHACPITPRIPSDGSRLCTAWLWYFHLRRSE
jgi:hypothetical protein